MDPPKSQVVFLFLVLMCFIWSFHGTEGKSLTRVKKSKVLVEPKHIRSLEQISDGVYAHGYGYGEPVTGYRLKERKGRSLRKKGKGKKKVRVLKWKGGVKNYAKRYKTWEPSKEFLTTRNHVLIDSGEKRPYKKRRRQKPFAVFEDETLSGSGKRRRRVRPQRGNHLRRPIPLRDTDPIYDEYEAEEYFPEETKRLEVDYDFDDKYHRPTSTKKRRNPGLRKKKPKKPEIIPKFPVEDERHYVSDGRYKPASNEPSVSYSNFIQHPTPTRTEVDYQDYIEEEEPQYVRKTRRRVKKKSNTGRIPDNYRDGTSADEDFRVDNGERYPPLYTVSDEIDPQRISGKQKRYKTRYEPTVSPTPTLYGEGHISNQNNFASGNRYPSGFIRSPNTPEIDPNFRSYRQTPSPFSPSDDRLTQPQGFSHPVQDSNVFDSNFGNQNRFNQISNNRPYRDYNSQSNQNFNVGNLNSGNPYLNTLNSNYVKNQVGNFEPSKSYAFSTGSNSFPNQLSSGSFQQPVFTRSPTVTNTGNPFQSQSYDSQYKPGSVIDNTDNFYDFNKNANVNSQNTKSLATSTSEFFQNNRQSSVLPNFSNSLKTSDPDNEFITKHQNLYNNGITGVPVQGDGFGKNKDYDIGYGEFQFDENPTT